MAMWNFERDCYRLWAIGFVVLGMIVIATVFISDQNDKRFIAAGYTREAITTANSVEQMWVKP